VAGTAGWGARRGRDSFWTRSKWLENFTFDSHDLAALQKHRAAITDEPVPLVAVARSGIGCSGLQAVYGPQELLSAWRGA
jgi:uncharacterized protein